MVFVPSFQSVCEDSAFAFDKRGARARNKPYAINRICEILRRSFKGDAARPGICRRQLMPAIIQRRAAVPGGAAHNKIIFIHTPGRGQKAAQPAGEMQKFYGSSSPRACFVAAPFPGAREMEKIGKRKQKDN